MKSKLDFKFDTGSVGLWNRVKELDICSWIWFCLHGTLGARPWSSLRLLCPLICLSVFHGQIQDIWSVPYRLRKAPGAETADKSISHGWLVMYHVMALQGSWCLAMCDSDRRVLQLAMSWSKFAVCSTPQIYFTFGFPVYNKHTILTQTVWAWDNYGP